jgi:catechol 2,3-dioxygenase-like lactoylglutathione lyase family enzyme
MAQRGGGAVAYERSAGGDDMPRFRMGALNHVHLVVPDRTAAARWYSERLGFEPVAAYAAWTRVEGGPLHMSADGGKSGIALFQLGGGHAATTLEMGAAFSVDAQQFVTFALSLESDALRDVDGGALKKDAVVDFDLCYAYNFRDPWGNRLELNCYDVAAVKRDLIEREGITPVRYW